MSSTTRTADSSNNNVSERPEKRQKTSAPIATLFAGRGSDTAATNTLPTLVTTTHTADPAGDLILQFPEQQQAICASSSVMKLCSPVFRAMLGPHFREGQGAADRPRMVPLPGDDAESMRVVCHALHHVDPAPTVTFDRLAGVARLVDKYDMVHALRPYIEAWLRKLMRGSEESEPSRIQMEHGADLLYATVLLDAPEAFMNWTRVLVLHHADSFLALKDEHDFVTSDILVTLEARRSERKRALDEVVLDKMMGWFKSRSSFNKACPTKNCAQNFVTAFAAGTDNIRHNKGGYALIHLFNYWTDADRLCVAGDSLSKEQSFGLKFEKWAAAHGVYAYCLYDMQAFRYSSTRDWAQPSTENLEGSKVYALTASGTVAFRTAVASTMCPTRSFAQGTE